MVSFFKELYEYNYHSNQKLIACFVENRDKTPEKSVKLINHLLNAQQIWNNRIIKKQDVFKIFQLHELHDLTAIDAANYEHSLLILNEDDLARTLSYVNSQGNAYTNSVKDILFHVINHSTYHRAQIASDFKANGIEPLITDYIFYKR